MFPVFKNKKFHDLATGKIITVVDQFEDVAILEGKGRVNITKLLDKNLFEEYIDPTTFFNSGSLQTLAEKIKSISNDVLSNIKEEENESIVLPYDPEEEKRMILEKARQINPMNSAQSQIEKFRDILDDDVEEILPRTQVSQPIQNTQTFIQESQYQTTGTETRTMPVQSHEEDPMVKLFKGVKRKQDFKFSLIIEDKIPRPDFIEMMEDSYEYSLIDFLADEFTKKLLSDPESIKEKIKKELNELVYKNNLESSSTDSIEKEEEKLTVKKTKTTKIKKEDDTSILR